MPRGKGFRIRLLDEERAGPHQDVRADHILDGVEDVQITDQIVEPERVGVGMRAPFDVGVGDRRTQLGLEPFEAGEVIGDLVEGQRRDWMEEAIAWRNEATCSSVNAFVSPSSQPGRDFGGPIAARLDGSWAMKALTEEQEANLVSLQWLPPSNPGAVLRRNRLPCRPRAARGRRMWAISSKDGAGIGWRKPL